MKPAGEVGMWTTDRDARRRYGLAILVAWMAALAGIVRAGSDPRQQILGMWVTQDKDGVIEIYLARSGLLEGRIVAEPGDPIQLDDKNPDPALRTRSLDGAVILHGFRYAGAGKWIDGTIYDPDDGKTYRCSLELKNATVLSVHGYIGLPLFGRSVLWTRKR
jgi:uncharacterized protein (DUF2147 family)